MADFDRFFNHACNSISSADFAKARKPARGLLSKSGEISSAFHRIKTIAMQLDEQTRTELLGLIADCALAYGEARVELEESRVLSEQRERVAKGRAAKRPVDAARAAIMLRAAGQFMMKRPKVKDTPNSVASAVLNTVNAELKRFGHRPVKIDGLRKCIQKGLNQRNSK